jgi:polyhydroxybutyrate depolymerase
MSYGAIACVLYVALAGCMAATESGATLATRERQRDAAPSAGCTSAAEDARSIWTVEVGRERRSVLVHLPPGYRRAPPPPTPLVLNFHGFRNFPLFQKVLSGLNDKADRAGFIVVYPQGSGDPLSFNGVGCCGSAFEEGVDDVAFTDAMLDELEQNLCIDRNRVYVTGFSNGGFMAQRLACERSERFAAAASVAGLLDASACTPGRPISMLEIHGTADKFVPYAGEQDRFLSARGAFDFWASADACTDAPQLGYAAGDTRCERHARCAAGSEVVLCTIEGGGHTWPGGLDGFLISGLAGKVSRDLSANDAIWAFFERHPLSGSPSESTARR